MLHGFKMLRGATYESSGRALSTARRLLLLALHVSCVVALLAHELRVAKALPEKRVA